ncbi:MAG: DUF2147 domain-containing protein [Rickettsiales bacterium]|nr:DUF2147 domain-containing protein [Rickettsiales bacterium]
MHNVTRSLISLILLVVCAPAMAEEKPSPVGQWKVEDGSAIIRLLTCESKLWGIIHWEKNPGHDIHNPDTQKQKTPMQGLPILLAMQKDADDAWVGRIYNADNGKIYHGSVTLKADNTLRITGCLFDGFLCGGENWTREVDTKIYDDSAFCAQHQ